MVAAFISQPNGHQPRQHPVRIVASSSSDRPLYVLVTDGSGCGEQFVAEAVVSSGTAQ